MQFYFLEKMPMFDGLYQIMKVEHTITPNDMTTSFEGMRMRFNPGSDHFSIPPITLGTLQAMLDERPRNQPSEIEANIQGESYKQSLDYERNSTDNVVNLQDLSAQYENGRLPESVLTESAFMASGGYIGSNKAPIKYKLIKEAANSIDQLMSAFKTASFVGKQKMWIKDGYRTYEEQVFLKQKLGGQAATPGKSNHGWAIAVDFWWGMPTKFRMNADLKKASFTHPNYKWLHDNAYRFGWINPSSLRDGGGLEEWWHWEYHGEQEQPIIFLAEYAEPFDFSFVPTLREKGATFVT